MKNSISDSSGVPLLASMFATNVSARTGVVRVRADSERQRRKGETDERRGAAREVRHDDESREKFNCCDRFSTSTHWSHPPREKNELFMQV